MLWLRGVLFTLLVPCVVGGLIPYSLTDGHPRGGAWMLGWVVVACGSAIYLLCLLSFLAGGGTPAPFFTTPVKWILGEEPPKLVLSGLYRRSRNPMYVGVLTTILGQAIVFASWRVAEFGAVAAVAFHLVVLLIEEPHLRRVRGAEYEEYCRQVPRWLGPFR